MYIHTYTHTNTNPYLTICRNISQCTATRPCLLSNALHTKSPDGWEVVSVCNCIYTNIQSSLSQQHTLRCTFVITQFFLADPSADEA